MTIKVPYKTKEQKLAAQQERDRQHQISELESLLKERYAAHIRLLATNATAEEIEEVKSEISLILAELEVLYNATTS